MSINNISNEMKFNHMGRIRTNYEIKQICKAEKLDVRMRNSFIRQHFGVKFKVLEQSENIAKQHQAVLDNVQLQNNDLDNISNSMPGFCFKHDGAERSQNDAQIYEKYLNFKCLENMLFSDKEIDNDKILLLHLMSLQKNYLLLTKGTNVEQVVENSDLIKKPTQKVNSKHSKVANRQKYNTQESITEESSDEENKKEYYTQKVWNKWLNWMPIYILELKNDSDEYLENRTVLDKISQTDERLKPTKVSINLKLIKILTSVLNSLKNCNETKFQQIINNSLVIEYVNNLLQSEMCYDLLKIVKNKQYLVNLNSYTNIDIYKQLITLKIEPSHYLERIFIESKDSCVFNRSRTNNGAWKLQSSSSSLFNTNSGTSTQLNTNRRNTILAHPITSHQTIDEEPFSENSGNFVNVIQQNISTNSLAQILSKRLRNTQEQNDYEMRKLKKSLRQLNTNKMMPAKHDTNTETSDNKSSQQQPLISSLMNVKPFTVRQSTCCACLNKYKNTSVQPKLVHRKRVDDDTSPFLCKDISHLSNDALTRELQKYNDQKKYEASNLYSLKQLSSNESVNLDKCMQSNISISKSSFLGAITPTKNYDDNSLLKMILQRTSLKRLEQEISKLETQKRLDRFLARTL